MLTAEVIEGFVTVLASKFDGATETPEFHKELWELCCSKNGFVAIAAPRNHAKTTAITITYGLATLLFRERKFMILVSDTETQASLFLGLYKTQLQDNPAIAELFGLVRDEEGRVKFIKDSETDIIVEMEDGHKFRVMAKGAEQKLRGLQWDGTRPDIILCDDMENDELVMNKERRDKMRKWFNSALLPSRSSYGIVRVVGTILHMDSLLERLMPKPYDRWFRTTDLKDWTEDRVGTWKSVKFRAHNQDYSEILWPDRWPKDKLVDERARFIAQGIPENYSQEFLNHPIDEANAYFKRNDFVALTKEDKDRAVNYYITVDLAISQEERADYSVFIVSAVDENKTLQIRNVIRERMDGREIVDTLINLQKVYKPEFVGIEEMQVSKAIGPFLREEMLKTGVYLNIVPLKHKGKDKIARARSIQARMRAQGVRFDKSMPWYEIFEDELIKFPRDAHDDQVDAFAYLGMLLDSVVEAPTVMELEEEEYLDELRQSDAGDSGRNYVCGY